MGRNIVHGPVIVVWGAPMKETEIVTMGSVIIAMGAWCTKNKIYFNEKTDAVASVFLYVNFFNYGQTAIWFNTF